MVYEYDKIVVGSTMQAVAYAFIKDYPIFYTHAQPPYRFDYLSPKLDLSFVKLPSQNKTLSTFGTKLAVGIQKRLLWERLLFLISLKGHVPLSGLCKNMRHTDGHITCSNEYSKIMEFTFNKCYYFDDPNASGFTQKTKFDSDRYLCYDYIAFNSGGKHEIDFINTPDDFVSKIWFYGSDRIDGNTPVRDACAVSTLNEKQLNSFDYSETMARFKTLDIMKKHGMRGKANGYTKKGTPRHYDFKTTSIIREVRSVKDEQTAASPYIEVKKLDEESLLGDLKRNTGPYNSVLGYLDESKDAS